LVGAEVVIDDGSRQKRPAPIPAGQTGHAADAVKLARDREARLTLLVADRGGYQNLCRMLTAGALAHAKGEARVD
jgi:DNA polymerase III alpha subunit